VALITNDLSEERVATIIRAKRVSELATALAVTSNNLPSKMIRFTLILETLRSPETSVLTRAIWSHILEDGIIHSHRRENLKPYIALNGWTL
jgi:hypothetical protein